MEVVGNVGIFQQGAYLKVHTWGVLENFLRKGNSPQDFLANLNILVGYRVDVGVLRGWSQVPPLLRVLREVLGAAGQLLSSPSLLLPIPLTGLRPLPSLLGVAQSLGEQGIEFSELPPRPWGKLPGLSILEEEVGLHPLPLANANRPRPGLVGAGYLRPLLPLILFITMFPTLPIGIYSSLSSLLWLSMLVSLSAIHFWLPFNSLLMSAWLLKMTSLLWYHWLIIHVWWINCVNSSSTTTCAFVYIYLCHLHVHAYPLLLKKLYKEYFFLLVYYFMFTF